MVNTDGSSDIVITMASNHDPPVIRSRGTATRFNVSPLPTSTSYYINNSTKAKHGMNFKQTIGRWLIWSKNNKKILCAIVIVTTFLSSLILNKLAPRKPAPIKPATIKPAPIKQKIILHVGPHKTGSTSLQCTLEKIRDQLEKDNIAYIGRPECANAGISIDKEKRAEFKLFENALVTGYQCHKELNEEDINVTKSCWTEFVNRLKFYKKSGKNIVFSDEAMSHRIVGIDGYRPSIEYPWKTLQSTLEGMGWFVDILIVHRPLYDYIPSVYEEQFKPGHNKALLARWFNDEKNEGHCPSHSGRKIPRPYDMKTKEITIGRLLSPGQNLSPTPLQVYETFQSHGFNVILVDMLLSMFDGDREINFIEHIICNIIPGSKHTCNALKDYLETTKNKMNPSVSLNYDFLAVEACQRGLLNGTLFSRNEAREIIKSHQEVELGHDANDFPLICPDDQILKEILRIDIRNEERICNTYGSLCDWDQKKAYHENQFWKIVNSKKQFCEVDAKAVISDPHWIRFFSDLNNKREKERNFARTLCHDCHYNAVDTHSFLSNTSKK